VIEEQDRGGDLEDCTKTYARAPKRETEIEGERGRFFYVFDRESADRRSLSHHSPPLSGSPVLRGMNRHKRAMLELRKSMTHMHVIISHCVQADGLDSRRLDGE
jgi:hypothetical protein